MVGLDAARRETDKRAGRVARLFVAGLSKWEIEFLRPGEKPLSEKWRIETYGEDLNAERMSVSNAFSLSSTLSRLKRTTTN